MEDMTPEEKRAWEERKALYLANSPTMGQSPRGEAGLKIAQQDFIGSFRGEKRAWRTELAAWLAAVLSVLVPLAIWLLERCKV